MTSFVAKFSADNDKLDVLINNAGCMINTREVGEEGLDKNFATNTLGTFLLTTGLVPLLQKSEAGVNILLKLSKKNLAMRRD